MTSDTLPRSASQMGSRNGFYPQHGYQQSHDTVYTNGSDSTGPWANSTDPTSSENSSIDKMHANGKRVSPQPVDNYGYDGYNGNTIREEYGQDNEAGVYGGPSGYNGVSAVPSHAAPAPAARAPIKLGGGGGTPSYASQGGSLPTMTRGTPGKEEKKKGWLSRRFSKKE